MTSHSWKCVTCSQSYRSKKAPARTPKCPSCGNLLVPDLRTPSPQPHSTRTRAGATATAGSRPSTRPAGPEEAIALSASSAWVPDPEPGPSPSTPGVHGTLSHDRLAADRLPPDPTAAPTQASAPRPPIHLYATVGGVALAAVVALVIIINRSGTPAKASANPPAAAAVNPAPAPAPVATTAVAVAAATTITSEPPVVAPLTRTVNLLKLIDPATDTLTGNWRQITGEFAPQLTSDATQHARLNIPYQPPQEYDFRVDFTRTSGDNCMTQIFTHQNSACLVLFGWKGAFSGFQQINNQNADKNPTGVRDLPTANGQRHTSIVKVRKHSLEAWLDGNLIIHYDTDGQDLGAKDWKIDAPLGIGTQQSPTTFHTIEITEITGHGKPLR